MFNNCSNLINLDISNFKTRTDNNMSRMFQNCSKITSLNLSCFNTENVKDMSEMFNNCSNLFELNFKFQIIVAISDIFN